MPEEPETSHEIGTDFHGFGSRDEPEPRRLHGDLTQAIIGAAFEVHRELGHGFLEKVYVAALTQELIKLGLDVLSEAPVQVFYKGSAIGQYFADLLINGLVICEIKAVRRLAPEHEAQLLHYLKGTKVRVGLLINFGGASVQVKRLIF